ncbi:hypothetical protein IFM89_001603 [Coptis chinensis]|uniref:phosphopyruvate hydratase n=1 Tax=Coptis chinensis TaxID=261450 RepID=A0A835HJU7_9MAGN|nr:hypothetical protein IFM89_001603 [Coptis chinensis]
MPSPEDLFSTLNRHIHRSDFEQAVKVSDQVLGIIPGDVDALRCKIVGLIKVDDYDKALSTIQNLPSTLNDFNFYKSIRSSRNDGFAFKVKADRSFEWDTTSCLLFGSTDEIHGGKNIVAYFSKVTTDNIDGPMKEFMILPVGASSFKEAMKMGVEVYHNLKVHNQTIGKVSNEAHPGRRSDEKVREMKDHVIGAKAHLNFASRQSNSHLVKRVKIVDKRDRTKAVGEASKDLDLSRRYANA